MFFVVKGMLRSERYVFWSEGYVWSERYDFWSEVYVAE